MSIIPRLNRLLASDGHCFDVAIDHGFFNERAFLDNIEDMKRVVSTIIEANPDAVQLSPGLAPLLQEVPGRAGLHLSYAPMWRIFRKSLPGYSFSRLIEDAVEQALVLDAACVVVNLFLMPDQPELHAQCIENICRLKPQCNRYGMPLMIELLVMQTNSKGGGYMVDGDLNKILPPGTPGSRTRRRYHQSRSMRRCIPVSQGDRDSFWSTCARARRRQDLQRRDCDTYLPAYAPGGSRDSVWTKCHSTSAPYPDDACAHGSCS